MILFFSLMAVLTIFSLILGFYLAVGKTRASLHREYWREPARKLQEHDFSPPLSTETFSSTTSGFYGKRAAKTFTWEITTEQFVQGWHSGEWRQRLSILLVLVGMIGMVVFAAHAFLAAEEYVMGISLLIIVTLGMRPFTQGIIETNRKWINNISPYRLSIGISSR